ncbi:hypothetical protein PA598K_03784 [Paenibacillus sp. 598K]|uniref:GDSL-type esterase/lipase family protein n=1 Tax=Paenibacillus sp. 598K TaxID=1117987 RepID=UPI000FF979FC|nr:GDSL-type esterase/lipase family protein [Paenibacillus sp. 598K]GBF75381.1 hypothetical protein PA598K_03784 [Paenibacillus sp. 598K]
MSEREPVQKQEREQTHKGEQMPKRESKKLWRAIAIASLASTVVLVGGFGYAIGDVMGWVGSNDRLIEPEQATEQAERQELRITALGDSLTRGVGDPNGRGYVNQVLDGLGEKLEVPVRLNNNLAVSGMRADELADKLESDSGYQYAIRQADLILLTIGGNDLFQFAQTQSESGQPGGASPGNGTPSISSATTEPDDASASTLADTAPASETPAAPATADALPDSSADPSADAPRASADPGAGAPAGSAESSAPGSAEELPQTVGGIPGELSVEGLGNRIETALERFRLVIERIHELNPDARLIYVGLYNPFYDVTELRPASLLVQQWNNGAYTILQQYPAMHMVPTYDLFEETINSYLSNDRFHPNGAGYGVIAERIIQIVE